jgi:hypothetical protein
MGAFCGGEEKVYGNSSKEIGYFQLKHYFCTAINSLWIKHKKKISGKKTSLITG